MMNCAIGQIRPYVPSTAMPWDRRRAVHLHRRAGFGARIDTILADLERSPGEVVDEMIARAQSLPTFPQPEYAYKTQREYGALSLLSNTLEKDGLARAWLIDMQKNGLRDRMAFFWHNHFVTAFNTHESAGYTWRYLEILQRNSLGNFRDFVREIGLTPAMLIFLNGAQNEAGQPNENYARELYELFTLGDDNGYTQADIEETARALTGYTDIVEPGGEINFTAATFDAGQKTIFGRTGNWGYDDVIDLLFEERASQIASFIAGKLYRNFVNPMVSEEAVAELADVFLAANWELAELLRALFGSEHFFDEKNLGTLIVGHAEHQLILRNELGIDLDGLSVFTDWATAGEEGQLIFDPVDVAGWPGNRSWINTTSYRTRWEYQEASFGAGSLNGAYYQALVRGATDETQDVEIICRDIIRYFLPKGLQFEEDYEAALVGFKGSVPENYFQDGIWNVNYFTTASQLAGLLTYLGRLPEFQLR